MVFSRDSHGSLGDGHTLLVHLLLGQVAWELCYFIFLIIKFKKGSLTVSLVLSWKQIPGGKTDKAEPCLGNLNHLVCFLKTITFSTGKTLHGFAGIYSVLSLALSLWVLGEGIAKFVSDRSKRSI